MPVKQPSPPRIIFFDGVCNLCNVFVNILIRLDKEASFSFAPLQGETAKKYHLPKNHPSLVYYDSNQRLWERSEAVLHILHDLAWWGRIFIIFNILPRSLRDGLYSWISQNRYRWFGQRKSCRLPNESEKARFLN